MMEGSFIGMIVRCVRMHLQCRHELLAKICRLRWRFKLVHVIGQSGLHESVMDVMRVYDFAHSVHYPQVLFRM
jgi:hypothetical protein